MNEINGNGERNNKSGKRGGRAIAYVAAGALLLGGVFGVQAFAESNTYAHMKLFAASENGETHRGRHGRHHRFADMSDAEIETAITRMVRHAAIEIDATDEQSEKIATLLTAVARDLKPMRDDMHAAATEIHELLLEDSIDRQALERVRAERLAEADRISKKLIDAIADVGEVLTAEQRKVLDERIRQFRGMRGDWRRG